LRDEKQPKTFRHESLTCILEEKIYYNNTLYMRSLKIIVIGIVAGIIWYSCVEHDLYNNKLGDSQIILRWNKGYPQETKQDVTMGLAWNLSFLGAQLPKGSLDSAIHWRNETMFSLSISDLGFSSEAQNALNVLILELKKTEEYQVTGGIDVGRFIMLTLNSSYHYYAITGAERNLTEFKAKYNFGSTQGAVINSSIAKGHRLVSIAQGTEINQIAFVAAEGEGFITNGTFQEMEYESLDIMPNGQLRFALYDKNGNLKSSASPELTDAGKPAKCLWCHETTIRSLNLMESVSGYYTYDQFNSILEEEQNILELYRMTLNSDIDFAQRRDHTLGELLYISFMEPSPFRLSQEWSMTEADVEAMLSGLNTHTHHEFSFFGEKLFMRKDVDGFMPYQVARVPENARDYSAYEPEIIRP
jgi:hypothetical protein